MLKRLLYGLLALTLIVTSCSAMRSKKPIGKSVSHLMVGLAIPVLGNLILVISTDQYISTLGCYVYFLGLDAAVIFLLLFTYAYCELGIPKKSVLILISSLFGIDLISYVLNPFLGFTFSTEMIEVDDRPYCRMIPHAGQTYHRAVCYGLFFASLVIFVIMAIRASKVYVEKYSVIAGSMIAAGALETYYIFSRQPLDMSMIAFGLFGILVFYFSLHYRSMRVLDKLLASLASDDSDAIFFFDKGGKCIWSNDPGKKLIGIRENYEDVKPNLTFLFDGIDFETSEWKKRTIIGAGSETQYLELTMHSAVDELGRITGSYLTVHDDTEDQRALQREIYKSTHDLVTGFFAKEYLFERIERRLKESTDDD